jgi:hypothetical protein
MSKTKLAQIYVARETFTAKGYDYPIKAGQTRLREGHPLLRSHADAFEPIAASPEFDIEQATAAPGERRNVSLTTQGEASDQEAAIRKAR